MMSGPQARRFPAATTSGRIVTAGSRRKSGSAMLAAPIRATATGWIVKPFNSESLLRAVRRVTTG